MKGGSRAVNGIGSNGFSVTGFSGCLINTSCAFSSGYLGYRFVTLYNKKYPLAEVEGGCRGVKVGRYYPRGARVRSLVRLQCRVFLGTRRSG